MKKTIFIIFMTILLLGLAITGLILILNSSQIGGGILIGLALIGFLFIVISYNKLVNYKNKVKESLALIDIQLKLRFDLIPNLVETVKGYAKHEESILTEFAKARGAYQASNGDIDKVSEANNALTSVLTRFMAVSEQYPELKADAHFTSMMATLKETEDKIAITRQFYNDTVTSYNTLLQLFPNVIFANMFGFHDEKLFKASEEEKKNVRVQF